MKIVFFWTRPSSYMRHCWDALAKKEGVDVHVCLIREAPKDMPADEDFMPTVPYRFVSGGRARDLERQVAALGCDALFVAGWQSLVYLRAAQALSRRHGVRVILCMDTAWRSSARQVAALPWLRRTFRVASGGFVAGGAAGRYARKILGMSKPVFTGLYSTNAPRGAAGGTTDEAAGRRGFIFLGRLSEEKGLKCLIAAYSIYRDRMPSSAWPLTIAGSGPLRDQAVGRPGIECLDFVRPNDVGDQLAKHACYVHAAEFEPWGVSILEAALCGLPIIVTNESGAAAELLVDGWNGFGFPARDADRLCHTMQVMTHLAAERRANMGHRSFLRGQAFTAEAWAERCLTLAGQCCDT